MNTTLLRAFPTLLFFLLVAPMRAQEPEESPDLAQRHREEVAARYDRATWPTGPARIGLASNLLLPGFVETEFQADEGFLTRSFRRVDQEDSTSFTLHTHVADDSRGAQEVLLTWLAGLQSPARMPDLAELGDRIGDVGFYGRSGAAPDAQAWVAFARGNVVVRLNAFDARRDLGLDLAALARTIDLTLLEANVVPDGAPVPRPLVSPLRIERSEEPVVAGAALPLVVAVTDPHAGTPHLRWIVGGSGLGYVERDADGRYILTTTGPGKIDLTLEVTGSTGTWARSTVSLDVLDD